MITQKENVTIDMWGNRRFIPKKYCADAYFHPHGPFGYCYRGNIYDERGKCIGDYGAKNSNAVEENFIIEWK